MIISTENVARAKLHIGKTLIAVQNVAQNISLESKAATNEEDASQSESDDDVDVLIKAREKLFHFHLWMEMVSIPNPFAIQI